eukprot:2465340-Prymnesium_polylepis.1
MPAQHSPLSSTSSRTAPRLVWIHWASLSSPVERRIDRRHGDHWSPCRSLFGGLAAASLAERIQEE